MASADKSQSSPKAVRQCVIPAMAGGGRSESSPSPAACPRSGSSTSAALTSASSPAPRKDRRRRRGQVARPPPLLPSDVNTATRSRAAKCAAQDGGAGCNTRPRATLNGEANAVTSLAGGGALGAPLRKARDRRRAGAVSASRLGKTAAKPSRSAAMPLKAATRTGRATSTRASAKCFGRSPRARPCQKKTLKPMPNPQLGGRNLASLPRQSPTRARAGSPANSSRRIGTQARSSTQARVRKARARWGMLELRERISSSASV
mmetsp:Transcript_261/g.878  ORF Transcript_261/g.878 Transcript_261/m.878 type:complete len:262 (+) Transcript_261:1237-2022(+)